MTTVLAWFGLVICTAFVLGSVACLWKATAPRRRPSGDLGHDSDGARRGPVTVLKPLCGADDDLEANLETFFLQRGCDVELLFGVEGEDDPAVAVVRRLQARYPQRRSRLVIHNGGVGLNPKVGNLLRTLESGSHDIVLISDSNVACPPDYVANMVERLNEPGVGMVTSLFAGVGEKTLGATLDNLHLTGHCAPSVALSQRGGVPAVVGKSMMFRRGEFEALGGLESVAFVLAEDYVMGRMVHEAGYTVALDATVVRNVNRHTTFGGFVRRHRRWGLIRSRLIPMTYLFEPLSNPIFMGLAASALGWGWWPLAWAIGLSLTRDVLCWWRLRGPRGLFRALPLAPFKDLLMLVVWVVAPFQSRVRWRDRSVRVSAGTRVYAETRS